MAFSLSKMKASSTQLNHCTIYAALFFGGSIIFLYYDGAPSQKNLNWSKYKPLPFILKNGSGKSQIVIFTASFSRLNSQIDFSLKPKARISLKKVAFFKRFALLNYILFLVQKIQCLEPPSSSACYLLQPEPQLFFSYVVSV